MTDAGFFRGTSSDQDNRFANKQKKLLKELNFSPILNTKLNMSKIDVDSLKPWIEEKIKDILEKEDDLLSDSIFEHLAEKEPDGKNILVLITGFVDETKASKFMEELWTKLIDLQDNSNGVIKSTTTTATNNTDKENPLKESDEVAEKTTKSDEHNESKNNPVDENARKESNADDRQSLASSRSESPPSRSVSKSPGNYKLDERSRGRPRKRLQDEVSREGSSPPTSDKKRNRSRSKSSSRSRSASISKRSSHRADGQRRGSRSSSRSKRSGSKRSESKSRSRSYSRSGSRSRSKSKLGSRSNSRSPRPRSRSPYSNSYRGRRSRSRDRGYRPRSRSPRGRRGYIARGPYRGSFGSFHDSRRRGTIGGPLRRRPSPWSSRARRYSPRSPLRRRRTPSFSPRRRRSPSPYGRRLSRSRSPVPVMRGPPSPPRRTMPGGHMDMMASRHMPHHDVHRPIMPVPRSPRGHIYHRSYGESQILTRHSPGPSMGIKQPDLPALSHGPISGQPGPSTSGMYSPSSSRKKHKKEKKHRKHKKSKKHRSPSPEKKKKHKKHKKTKKHKSH